MFEFVVLCLAERLQMDSKLAMFFSNFDTTSPVAHETQFLTTAFTKDPLDHAAKSCILLRHYSLIHNKGFNETHFDILVDQYSVEATEDAWIDNDVIADAIEIVKSFRNLFTVQEENEELLLAPSQPKKKEAACRSSSTGFLPKYCDPREVVEIKNIHSNNNNKAIEIIY
jgi:hypothetical protein